jgi:hypothetical protein
MPGPAWSKVICPSARFKAGSKRAKLLVEQLRDFPCGEFDDGPDSLEIAFRLACEQLSRIAEEALARPIYIPIESCIQ